MSLSSVELWQRISSAGLAAPLICRSWAADALKELQPSDASNAEKILEQLVKLGRLTEYQADLISGRREGEFKRGGWTLLRPVSVPLWDGWFEAVKSPMDAPSWLRWLSSDALTKLKEAAPSLPRGLRLAQIKGACLQGVFIPELIDKQLQLQVHQVQGLPLSLAVQKDASIAAQSARIVRQVAEGLRPLHAAQIAHGRVMPDRIFYESERVTLVRDPICSSTGSLATDAVGVIQNGLNGLTAAQFMAPEFLAPGQVPTPSSDIYSLGCVWWWLLTGKPLVVGSTVDKQLARQAEASIALPKECTLAPPLLRCLQHCLAKNLPARFESAEALCVALDAALASVAKGPVKRERTAPSAPVVAAKLLEQTAAPKSEMAVKTATVVPTKSEAAVVKATEVQPVAAAIASTKSDSAKPTAAQPVAKSVIAEPTAKATPVKAQVVAEAAKPAAEKLATETSSMAKAVQATVANVAEKPAAKSTGSPKAIEATVVEPREQVAAVASAAAVRANKVTQTAPSRNAIEAKDADASRVKESLSQNPDAVADTPVADREPEFVVPVPKRKPTAKTVRKVKRKPANKWALPVLGGLTCICLLLGVLIVSGAFKPSRRSKPTPTEVVTQPKDDSVPVVDSAPSDPRLEAYRIVESGKDLLWAPPSVPQPISLEMLPPGGQMFLTLRPKRLLSTPTSKSLLSAFNDELSAHFDAIGKRAGVPFESIERVTVAFFAENEVLTTCMRVQLAEPRALAALKGAWGSPADEKVDSLVLLTNASGDSYFVAQQPLTDAQSVTEYSVGPTALMRETAEARGATGPLVSQVEKLWSVSDAEADVSLLVATPFLFSEGKSLLAMAPKRLASRLREMLEGDSRAALLQTRFEPSWYIEAQLMGTSERESPRLNDLIRQRLAGAAAAVEDWFVSEQPHPYWRPLALRYPQMLRVLAEQSRFGIERGAAVMNAYLPSEAANNILLSTWVASQDGATLASDMPAESTTATTVKPLTIEEYLARPIKLSFDQEPIESALRLVGEEANANLPAGTPQLRFALDGGAFERAGITRNQQLRDFKHVNLPMRDALTAIAKRGNPVTTVKDTREEDQRLIWVVRDDPQQPGKQMISLTTRAEATNNNIPLPVEFAPAKP